MSEHTGNRQELDDFNIEDWNLAFAIFDQYANDYILSLPGYIPLVSTMPAEIAPMFSIENGEVVFSMRIRGVTQKQAVLIAFSNTLTAFENAHKPLVIKTARIASRSNIERAISEGGKVIMQDISMEVIDLERQLTSIRDIEWL